MIVHAMLSRFYDFDVIPSIFHPVSNPFLFSGLKLPSPSSSQLVTSFWGHFIRRPAAGDLRRF